MSLDPKALEAAWAEFDQWAFDARGRKALAAAIASYLSASMAGPVPEGWKWPDLNVTTEELIRIKNTCVGKDGDVKIWSKMLWIMIEYILDVRAFEKEVRSSPRTKTAYIRAGEHGRDGQNIEVPVDAAPAQVAPSTFVIQIEADNSERYAIFSTMEKAEAWAAKTQDLTHIFADLVIDMPEWGNEAVEQRQ